MRILRSGIFDYCWSEFDLLSLFCWQKMETFTDLYHRYGRLVDDDRYNIGYTV
jgi:hypothetical protein